MIRVDGGGRGASRGAVRTIAMLLGGLLVGLAAGFGLGRSTGGAASSARPNTESAVVFPAGSLARLEAQVTALAGLVDELALRPARVPDVVAASRRPAVDHDAEILARLDGLATSLEALRASAVAPEERLAELRAAKPGPDWDELDELLALWRVDPQAARADVLLTSEARVLERYGTPSLIWGEGKWVYGRGKLAGRDAWALQVVLRVQDGLVRELWVEE